MKLAVFGLVLFLACMCVQEVRAEKGSSDSTRTYYVITETEAVVRIVHQVSKKRLLVSADTLYPPVKIDFSRKTYTGIISGKNGRVFKIKFGGPRIDECPVGWENHGRLKYGSKTIVSMTCDERAFIAVYWLIGIYIGTWEVFPMD